MAKRGIKMNYEKTINKIERLKRYQQKQQAGNIGKSAHYESWLKGYLSGLDDVVLILGMMHDETDD